MTAYPTTTGDDDRAVLPLGDPDRDPSAPPSVLVSLQPRTPVTDPSLGIAVPRPTGGAPANTIVAIGDSLTQGFQSGAIFNTDISWPAIVAYEAGCLQTFRRPHYAGFGGLPLNLEYVIRDLENTYGDHLTALRFVPALFRLRHLLGEICDWWERGPGARIANVPQVNHNLATFGYDLRDALSLEPANVVPTIANPHDSLIAPMVAHAKERASLRTLPYWDRADPARPSMTALAAARELGDQGCAGDAGGDGIETLFVLLGANNALRTVTELNVVWSDIGYDDLSKKSAFTVWQPTHFASELALVTAAVAKIKARHVIWGTVPHVTIAPIARGVGAKKVRRGSRYFNYYTRPWISDRDFEPHDDPHITAVQARAIDSAIDQYNDAIVNAVRRARRDDGRDWYVYDVAGLLDRLAQRRYIDDADARPVWWTPYPLPAALAALKPPVDSRFWASDRTGRTHGGLFSLDGVHPTTVGYGILAQEMIAVMERAGVRLRADNGVSQEGGVSVDFHRLLALDSLMASPPTAVSSDLALIGWLNDQIDFAKRLFGG